MIVALLVVVVVVVLPRTALPAIISATHFSDNNFSSIEGAAWAFIADVDPCRLVFSLVVRLAWSAWVASWAALAAFSMYTGSRTRSAWMDASAVAEAVRAASRLWRVHVQRVGGGGGGGGVGGG